VILGLLLACTGGFPASVKVQANPNDPLGALVTVGAVGESGLTAWVESTVDGDTLDGPETSLSASDKTTLVVRGLLGGQTAEITVVATDGGQRWTSPTRDLDVPALPSDWPVCTVTTSDPAWLENDNAGPSAVVCSNGVLRQALTGVSYCVDLKGRPRWSLAHATGLIMRVVRSLPDGGHAAVGYDQSALVIFDAQGRETGWYTPTWFADQTRFVHDWIDGHELLVLNEGPWQGAVVILTSTWDEVSPDTWRLGYGIIVFDPVSETVLWDWSAHGKLGDGVPIDPAIDYDRLGTSATDPERFMHSNALVYRLLPDGSPEFWMSVRHQDWIIAIDPDTDAVRWRLGLGGDFTLVDDLDAATPVPLSDADWFFAQHGPAIESQDGDRVRMILFDNGKWRPGLTEDEWYSRALELTLDLSTMQAAPGFIYGDPSGPDSFFALGGGNAAPIGDGSTVQVLKGWDATAVSHISYPQGDLLWRWECPDLPDEQEQYRAIYLGSVYE